MIRRPPRSTLSSSSAASDVYKRQGLYVDAKDYTKAEESYNDILRELTKNKNSYRRNSAYIVALHAAQIELYTLLDQEDKLGLCYEKAMVLLSGGTEVISRVGGVVHLCGGRLYMVNGEYENARVEFNRAFESFVDDRQIESLKYLVVATIPVSYTHLRAHETPEHLVCRLLLEKKKQKTQTHHSHHPPTTYISTTHSILSHP
eukprot:TRINITY_DN23093_c0_g1_i1.p1 TRINITY_DN23093_c0_g1~~TRINITY_DN23093_c0_g1_i1.p1  ORF type:complete len:203 (-),score=51.37 TRINITY_DN23093_c0_g1_i1:32-640(-)